jgi:acyl-CoA synthetase (AMP-forming)/AMP-acid ligase II
MITARNLQTMALAYFVDVDQVYRRDAALYAAPLSHGAGLYNFMHVIRGARHVVPESGSFDVEEIARLAPQVGDVSMFAAPTMVRRLVDHASRSGWAGEGIRTIVYGGGPMYLADIVEAVEVMGPRFVQIYGQGESPMTITSLSRELVADRRHPRWRERLASVGTAQSPVEVMVADDEGPRTATRRGRRDPRARRRGHARLLEQPGGDGRHAQGRLAVDRRHRDDGRGRLPDAAGPLEGRHHIRRHQHLSARGGGGAAFPSQGARGGRRRRPQPEWGEEVVAFVVASPVGGVAEGSSTRIA